MSVECELYNLYYWKRSYGLLVEVAECCHDPGSSAIMRLGPGIAHREFHYLIPVFLVPNREAVDVSS